ncbi:MAG: preprotein translocase subunit SecE [Catonella sp.]|jgi:preprotein translocase subunit SecE|nr:preprotein translocase subunit SecE [Catonella sp.]MDY6357048.1 preprotein translocase subunit SecE [Catonella sp.]
MEQTTNAPAEKQTKKKNSFFDGVKTEFKKIIWPTKKDLGRESTSVIATTVVLGLIISLLDLGLQKLIGNVL